MFNLFKKNSRLLENFIEQESSDSIFSLNYNEKPLNGILTFQYGLDNDYIELKNDGSRVIIATNLKGKVGEVQKELTYTTTINKHIDKIIEDKINQTIEKLKELSPKNNDGEDKAYEWFRVSSEVLINAIENIDHIDTILQFKLFWGQINDAFRLRVLLYNLDIELTIMDEGLLLTVFDTAKDEVNPQQRFLYKQIYNDVFNRMILILNELKKSRQKLEV